MSNEKNPFHRLMDLFADQPKLITISSVTDSLEIGSGDLLVAPVNDLVLVDAKSDSRSIVRHGNIIKYFIVSRNKILFNGNYCSVAILIEEEIANEKDDKTVKYRVFNLIFNAETVAIHCSKTDKPVEPVGNDPNFVGDASNFDFTRYVRTDQEGVFVHERYIINIMKNLKCAIDEKGIEVSVVLKNQPQNEAPQ